MPIISRYGAQPTEPHSYDKAIPYQVGSYHSAIEDPGISGEVQDDYFWRTKGIHGRTLLVPRRGDYSGFSVNGNANDGDWPNSGDPVWPEWKTNQSRRNEIHHGNQTAIGTLASLQDNWFAFSAYFPTDGGGWHGGVHDGFKNCHIWQHHPPQSGVSPTYVWTVGYSPNWGLPASPTDPDTLKLHFRVNSVSQWSLTMPNFYDRWTDFVMHIVSDRDGTDGLIEMCVNKVLKYSLYNAKTHWESGTHIGYNKHGGYGQPIMWYWADVMHGVDSSLAEMTPYSGRRGRALVI